MAISPGHGHAGFADWVGGLAERAGGVELVLVREKHLGAAEQLGLCRNARRILGPTLGQTPERAQERNARPATRVLVAGGRVDLALAAGLDGVHLSAQEATDGADSGELRVEQVRRLFPAAFVTVSCHTPREVERARQQGASAALFAPVFGKAVNGLEVVPAAGLDLLRQACAAAGNMPVLALGGVTPQNLADCLAAGAAGVAGIRIFNR